jgi:outer membrane protein assembly factor BamB
MKRERSPNLIGLSLTAALLLVILMLVSPTVLAQQQALDWARYNAVPGNWNWSPQKELNKENVKFLEIKWAFPVPPSSLGDPFFTGSEGVIHTPLIYKGVVYFVTNWHRVYALDLATGKTLWFRDLPPPKEFVDQIVSGKPPLWEPFFKGHFHQIHIYEIDGKPYLFIVTNYYYLTVLDPLTGDIKLRWPIFTAEYLANVPGNRGVYDISTPSFVVDTKRKIMVIGTSTTEDQGAGRGFFVGVDLKPWLEGRGDPRIIWRTFIIPPQDGSDPEWTLKLVDQMKGAWIFDWTRDQLVNLKTLPDNQKRQLLYDDWGFARFVQMYPDEKVSNGGAGAGWGGSYAVDEDRGLVYIGTNQPAPDFNATFRPGPNLWSDSILAINVETGQIVWGVQSLPHDIWDWDCAWSVILVKNVMIGGQRRDAVIKGCKSGAVFALDPDDGHLLWVFNPMYPAKYGGDPRYGIKPSKYVKPMNPLDPKDMSWRWQGEWTTGDEYEYLKSHKPFYQNPPATGGLESDPAYDPERNRLFVAVYNMPAALALQNVGPGTGWPAGWGISFETLPAQPTNTTIYAIDVNTGRVVWNVFVPDVPYRGGLTVSNGLVFATFIDGTLRIYDADTGAELKRVIVGGPMVTQVSIAADANGRIKIVVPVSNSLVGIWGPYPLSGYVVALGLPEVIAERTVVQEMTVVRTEVQTAVTTQVVTQVQTQIREVEVEVIPVWVYAVAGIAVVAVIAAATLAARGRRR